MKYKSLESQIYGSFPEKSFVEILLDTDFGVKRICIIVPKWKNKLEYLRKADLLLKDVVAQIPYVESIAIKESKREFLQYCIDSNLEYDEPNIAGFSIYPDGAVSYDCLFFGDLEDKYITIERNNKGDLSFVNHG